MENVMHIDISISENESDARAWRELMRATDKNTDDAIMRAWQNWRDRESRNGRPNRTTNVDH